MDQAARERGTAMSTPQEETSQKTPEELRAEIAQTRADLGDTVEALAEKSDVTAQAKARAAAVKHAALDKKAEFASRARNAAPDSAEAGAQQVVSTIQRRPAPFAALGAFASGVLAGWMLGRR
jgi:ABC-type transporter Mla subunit MlaD